jgi:Schlafen, AlbA_2
MADLISKALSAKRESKYIEFKQNFDPSSPGEFCELTKDIVAIANSGGGIVVFGLDSSGKPSNEDLGALQSTDPADITNKLSRYIGPVAIEFEMRELAKEGAKLLAFVVQPVTIPIVFQKPGTYEVGGGRQKSAFAMGTVYFRHGAKSEPGTTEDMRNAIQRQLDIIRKSWLKGVRKVVQAPQGSQIVAVPPNSQLGSPLTSMTVRVVRDPKATPILLTRDSAKATGAFVHEEISQGIFDEINNVVDANRALAKGQQRFFLGQPIYYRVYAERQHVEQKQENVNVLFRSAALDFYAPTLFWMLTLSEELTARTLTDLYLEPKGPHIYLLMRTAVLLGPEFSKWLLGKWQQKWKRHPQPPSFYFTFGEMISKLDSTDPRLLAARMAQTGEIALKGEEPRTARELLNDPQCAATLLSKACIQVFEGAEGEARSAARNLDYFAYGLQLRDRAPAITKAIMSAVGTQKAGDFAAAVEPA